MCRSITISVFISFVFIVTVSYTSAQQKPQPFTRAKLLALIAGKGLPENVIAEINLRGIAFKPDIGYLSLLKTAGATPDITNAVSSAALVLPIADEPQDEVNFLRLLSRSGKLRLAKNYQGAINEIAPAIEQPSHKAPASFVAGSILLDTDHLPEAIVVYREILQNDPDFPEVHTKLSYAYYTLGETEEALRQATAALQQNPNNPTAHLNAGLCYQRMGKPDAAGSEYQSALKLKPDFALAHTALANLHQDHSDFDDSIAQYKKSLQTSPDDVPTRYNMANAYAKKGDLDSAIREYREVLRRDPDFEPARQNLGAALLQKDPTAAAAEFRIMQPSSTACHACLGAALAESQRFDEAEKEYRIAIQMEPDNPGPRFGLGAVLESEKKYTLALTEYRRAIKLDDAFAPAHKGAGRMLLEKNDFAGSLPELKRTAELTPADWEIHDLLGQALHGSGDRKTAIAEFKQAVSLAPKELQARLDLAQAQEKSGEWIEALQNYHQAAIDQPARQANVVFRNYDAEGKYAAAKERFQKHLAGLRQSGKVSEAASLESALADKDAVPNVDARFHDAMQAATAAAAARNLEEAETAAKQAVSIAEKIQPMDGRLPEALGKLGNVYLWRLENKKAGETFSHQLALTEKLYGPQSPLIATPLQNLAMTAVGDKDFTTAATIFNRIYDIDRKAYGKSNATTADALRGLAFVYRMSKDYPNAEKTLLQVVEIYRTMYGAQDKRVSIPMTALCQIYEQWGKADKAQSCHENLSAFAQQQ